MSETHPSNSTAPIDLLVFDWDGTLIDSTAAITDSLCQAAADLRLPVPSRERASHVIGMGLLEAIRYAVPSIAGDQIAPFVEAYRRHFVQLDARIQPFPGIEQMLEGFDRQGVPLAVATGKSRAGLDRALSQLGWRSLFLATRCADEGLPKPDPWMLRDLCSTLGYDPRRALVVGDTTHDLGMAAAAGSPSVAVTYGAHPRESLAKWSPLALVDDVEQLKGFLHRQWRQGRNTESATAQAASPAEDGWLAVCAIEDLIDGAQGLRFELAALPTANGRASTQAAFVIRHEGQARAYLNQCGHVPVELDWPSGQFFDDSGLYLVCATHGATYRPSDGSCAGGPCRGRGLVRLNVRESLGKVWVALATSRT